MPVRSCTTRRFTGIPTAPSPRRAPVAVPATVSCACAVHFESAMTFGLLVPHGAPPGFFTFPSLTALGLPHATTTRHFDGATPFMDPAGPFRLEGARGLGDAGIDLGAAAYLRQMHAAD